MRFAKLFNSDLHNVHHAAFWLAVFSLLSAFLGMFRDRLLAGHFGASRELDIYYAAFRVPDFIYTLMLLFTASTALIPIFLETSQDQKKSINNLIGSLIIVFSSAVFVLGLAAFFLMPYFVGFSFSGFSFEEKELTVLLSRILLVSPLLLGLSNIFASVTQTFGRFFIYGLSPVVYNLGIIFGILTFMKFWDLPGLAAGVILGAVLHMGVQTALLWRLGVKPNFSGFLFEDIRNVVALSLPRTISLQVGQILSIILTGVASTLAVGSITVFNLASNLEFIPITVIGLSYSIAAFPALAEYSLKKAKEHFETHFSAAFRHILFWALPFSLILLTLRAQIVRVILGSGNFSWSDTRLTAASLMLLAFAVTFQSAILLLVRAFHAEGEVWRPLFINIISTLFGAGAVFWFVFALEPGSAASAFLASLLRISDIYDIRVIALSMGVLIGSVANFLLLALAFWRVFGWAPWKGAKRSVFEITSAGICGALGAYSGLAIFAGMFNLHTFFGVLLQGIFSGILGIFIAGAFLWVLKNRELLEIHESVLKILREEEKEKAEHKVPPPEPEKLP